MLAAAALLAGPVPAGAQATSEGQEAPFRFQAPITIEQPAAFVRLPLPVSSYAMSRQADLADLRVVDANGARVPFALLGARAPAQREAEVLRPVDLYPLPARRPGDKDLASPVEVQVIGERITVRRLARPSATGVTGATESDTAGRPAPGWLFDLGERPRDEPPPVALRLEWRAAGDFTAAFEIETSDDLRQWRRGGGGQLLDLASATGRLALREVRLPGGEARLRFVRLRWIDPAQAPRLSGAQAVRVTHSAVVLDAPATWSVAPGPEPTPPATGVAPAAGGAAPAGALHYDLGAVLPLVEIDLALPATRRLAAVRVQGRTKVDDPWQELAQTVFYRIERGDVIDRPPPLALPVRVRYLRLLPDARGGALDGSVSLDVKARLQSVVFAPQGPAPFSLRAGSAGAAPGALPLSTLVPSLEQERPRFGRASLGAWSENAEVARAEASRERMAAWRPWLLWGVLLVGVGALAAVVWRLARGAGSGAGAGAAGTAPGAQPDVERST